MIPSAVYESELGRHLITPFDIASRSEYHRRYKDHLICSEDGCSAKIDLAHRNDHPYFRTRRNSRHAEGCRYAFENDPSRVSLQTAETELARISADHKRRALDYANAKRRQRERGESGTSPRASQHRPTHPVTERRGSRRVPSVDPNAPAVGHMQREPRIPLRYAENITARDVGRLINVYGMTSQAVIRPGENGSVRFVFDAENQASVSFFHRFRDQSIQQYDWISEIAASVNGDHGMLESLALACIGVCEKTNDGGYSLQVMEGDCISINDKSLSAFMRDWRI